MRARLEVNAPAAILAGGERLAGNNRKLASPFRSHSGICGICFGTNTPLPDPFPPGVS